MTDNRDGAAIDRELLTSLQNRSHHAALRFIAEQRTTDPERCGGYVETLRDGTDDAAALDTMTDPGPGPGAPLWSELCPAGVQVGSNLRLRSEIEPARCQVGRQGPILRRDDSEDGRRF